LSSLGSTPTAQHTSRWWLSSAAASGSAKAAKKPVSTSTSSNLVIEASKKDIPQSPWKMNFLVKLLRGAWVPDALAQLKFSPKHRAADVSKIVKRASAIANIYHEAIPEELLVKEIFVTKGLAQKRMRIMGRGRTGIGYMRKSHVTVKVEKINFEERIAAAKTASQKAKWAKIQTLVAEKRKTLAAGLTASSVPAKSTTTAAT